MSKIVPSINVLMPFIRNVADQSREDITNGGIINPSQNLSKNALHFENRQGRGFGS